MKRLSGTTLSDQLGKAPRERLLRAFVDVCNAVAFAHTKGIVHRDLKPANIGLGEYGEVYVLDWGIARVLDETDEPDLVGSADDADHTGPGATVGTAGYMAPEQIGASASVDLRADVYSLGCILFEILAGERLVPRGVTLEAQELANIDARPAVRGKHVPPELEALCVAATAFERDQRIASAKVLGDRVQAFLDGDRDVAQRKELARRHLAVAKRAFEQRATDAGRATAMREAGRALALDPALDEAADLVTRLMLEPPTAMPPDVAAVVKQEDDQAIARNARLGRYAYLAFVAFIPMLMTSGRYEWAIALASVITLNLLCVTVWRSFGEGRRMLVALANCALIAVLALMYSPFFIAPGVAAIATMVIVHSPDYDQRGRAIWLGVGMAAAILIPQLLEEVGVISRTMEMTNSYISFAGPAVGMPHTIGVAALVMYMLALLGAAAWIGHAVRVAERSARTHLHLQAWQLAQLVPANR
jgi:serine/threonine-protein kinase